MLQQVQKAVIDRVHAVARSDLDQTGEHGESTLANAAANPVIHSHDLRGQHPPFGVNSWQEMLADNAAQTAR